MSSDTSSGKLALRELPWQLWISQGLAVARLELKRIVIGRRSLGVLLLSLFPIFISLLAFLFAPGDGFEEVGGASVAFAIFFRTVLLRLIIFFGSVLVFTGLFRGEVLENTLHYYMLTPAPRGVLVAGKFAAGVQAAFLTFGLTAASCFLLFHAQGNPGRLGVYLFDGPGAAHLAAYLIVVALAVAGYGAAFLLAGLTIRNPMIPAVLIFFWEAINPFLPMALKQISVIYYLESLCPVAIPQGPVVILADPAPAWVSIPGVLALSLGLLALATFRLMQAEINYTGD